MQIPLLQSLHDNSLVSRTEPRLLTRAWEYQNQLSSLFLRIFSPKQLTRPDSLATCCRQVIPCLKQSFMEQCWKVFFITKSYIYPVRDEFLSSSLIALSAINELEQSLESGADFNQYTINSENTKNIEIFLSQPLSDSDYIKLNAHLSFSGNNKLWRTLKACKELFLPIQENCAETIQTKMLYISKSLNESLDAHFNSDHKLTPKDLRLLTVAGMRKKLLMVLKTNSIKCPFSEKLLAEWEVLEKLNYSDTMDNIRNRCGNGYKAGRIFFYDWNFVEIRDFYPLDLSWAVKHILYSRIPHLGIIIQDDQNKPKLSHVNGAMGTHGIHPIKFPILGALGNFGELDITPLIPAVVIPDHHNQLKKCFSDAFIKFASEMHPEVKLEWKPTCFLWHKGLSAQDLSDVELTSKEPQFCSSYVGVIFLKAVNAVNLLLSGLGYEEKIPHPFGEHEIVNRVDTLRLIYHWKQLNVLKVVALDPFVDKVFAAPKL